MARQKCGDRKTCGLLLAMALAAVGSLSQGFLSGFPAKAPRQSRPAQPMDGEDDVRSSQQADVAARSQLRGALGAVLLGALCGAGKAVNASLVQYNAQLAGDLSDAQKKRIAKYMENKKRQNESSDGSESASAAYIAPTSQELSSGSPEFKARVARIAPSLSLSERLIDAQQTSAMIKAGAIFVDVRTAEEVETQSAGEMPASAVLIPFNDWVGTVLPSMQGKKIVLTCNKGNKSTLAWESLRSQNADAYVLRGGLQSWRLAGLPTKRLDA